MHKKVLSEQVLYYGDVKMPEGWEINPLNLCKQLFDSLYHEKDCHYCKDWDKLNTYIREHIRIKHNLIIETKDSWANAYIPNEKTKTLNHVDPMNLADSADLVLLYGINTLDCKIVINFDDNKEKGKVWNIDLKQNKFVMFPSTNTYSIENNQKNSLNFIQTITYERI
jgi:hypothetical protein|tara:strand:- start:334 stop:837 length:504 start_codon:yes stop_codon:yes gene_type:complete